MKTWIGRARNLYQRCGSPHLPGCTRTIMICGPQDILTEPFWAMASCRGAKEVPWQAILGDWQAGGDLTSAAPERLQPANDAQSLCDSRMKDRPSAIRVIRPRNRLPFARNMARRMVPAAMRSSACPKNGMAEAM
jgi:hypothetical protein